MYIGFIQLVHQHHDDGQLCKHLEGKDASGYDVVLKKNQSIEVLIDSGVI